MQERTMYEGADIYDIENSGNRDDIDFFVKCSQKYKGPILELACGTGILTLPIAKEGIAIEGLDLSSAMLRRAKIKAKGYKNVHFYRKNMMKFNLNKKYRMIFIGFNSIFHLKSSQEISAMLDSVKAHLEPEGVFIVDCFIPDSKYLIRDINKTYPVHNEDGLTIVERNEYDTILQVNHIEWFYSYKNEEWIEKFDLRMYYPQELQTIIEMNGFTIHKAYGDHDFSTLESGSRFQIYECKIKK